MDHAGRAGGGGNYGAVWMKRYAGERLDDGSVRVIVCDDALYGEAFARWTVLPPVPAAQSPSAVAAAPAPSLSLVSRRFDWGLEADGGVELARAILMDCLGREVAEHLYQDLEWSVIRGLQHDAWELDEEIIRGMAEIQPILHDARLAATPTAA
jgi:hypothetical protein